MTSRIHGLSLSSIQIPQSFKQHHRLTILFGAVLLVSAAYFLAARSLTHRAQIRSIEALYKQGKQNFAEGKYTEAIQNYKEALRHNPTENMRKEIDAGLAQSKFARRMEIAGQHEKEQNYDQAIKCYLETAALCSSTDVNALGIIHLRIAKVHSVQQNYQLAHDSASTALNCHPTNRDLLTNIQKALADSQQKLNAKTCVANAKLLLGLGKLSQAIREYKAALAYLPVDPLLKEINEALASAQGQLNNKVQELYDSGLRNLDKNIDQALVDFKEALNCDPSNNTLKGKIYYQLGVCYRKKREYDLAMTSFNEASYRTINQIEYACSFLERGLLFNDQKQDLNKALLDYEVVIHCTRDVGTTPNLKLQAIARLLKSNLLILRQEQLSDQLRKQALYEALHETLLACSSAEKMNPQDKLLLIEIHYQWAICHHLLGNFGGAKDGYTMVLNLGIENPYTKASILCDRAFCYEKLTEPNQARQDYDEAAKCAFTDDHFLKSPEFLHGAPLKILKRGASVLYKNSVELKATINAGKERLAH